MGKGKRKEETLKIAGPPVKKEIGRDAKGGRYHKEMNVPNQVGLVNPDKYNDLTGHKYTNTDILLDKIYGDHVHAKDGTHLDRGIVEDRV